MDQFRELSLVYHYANTIRGSSRRKLGPKTDPSQNSATFTKMRDVKTRVAKKPTVFEIREKTQEFWGINPEFWGILNVNKKQPFSFLISGLMYKI